MNSYAFLIKKALTSVIVFLALAVSFGAWASADPAVVVLYTNDVHAYINNTKGDPACDAISYSAVAALKKSYEKQNIPVILADAGDAVLGDIFGTLDKGEHIIELMNAAGYDIATFGNHEFDYGIFRLFALMDKASFPYVSCNFYDLANNTPAADPYRVFKAGDIKIAFVGISTPETLTHSAPVYFQDHKGNYIYDFLGDKSGHKLYEAVQKSIDEAAKEADFVIALGHTGIDDSSSPFTSKEIIANTHGLTAYIDGHSHSSIPMLHVMDNQGKEVVLTQTGSRFYSVGLMQINTDGSVETSLVTSLKQRDETVLKLERQWIDDVLNTLSKPLAKVESALYAHDPGNLNNWLVRHSESNLGDLCADSIYYLLNEIEKADCDAVILNGGGVRADVNTGEFSVTDAYAIMPFNNHLVLAGVSGETLLNALEFSYQNINKDYDLLDGSNDNGAFFQIAGLKLTIDHSIKPSSKTDSLGRWAGGPSESYKVKDVMIYNRESHQYEPLQKDRLYNVASIDYILENGGCGMAMFTHADNLLRKHILDHESLMQYLRSFTKDDDSSRTINTKSSPLIRYENYLIDYEDPKGSGRITIK